VIGARNIVQGWLPGRADGLHVGAGAGQRSCCDLEGLRYRLEARDRAFKDHLIPHRAGHAECDEQRPEEPSLKVIKSASIIPAPPVKPG